MSVALLYFYLSLCVLITHADGSHVSMVITRDCLCVILSVYLFLSAQ